MYISRHIIIHTDDTVFLLWISSMSFQTAGFMLIIFHNSLLWTAAVGQYKGGDLRLVGGSYQWEGRVEIYLSGMWGTITDSDWTSDDATAVCRKMGYFRPGALGYITAYFGEGSGPIHIDHIMCSGIEYSLTECEIRNRTRQTDHGQDVGVKCNTDDEAYREGDIRLVGGAYNWEGRVEIFWSGSWTSVSDTSWSSSETRVVCRQLALPTEDAEYYCCGHYGEGSGLYQFTVSCTGNEINITSCDYANITNQQNDVVGVKCSQGGDVKEGDIRLVGGSYSWGGRVEIYLGGKWGTITDDRAGYTEAHVVCRQLGYSTQYGLDLDYHFAFFGEGIGPIHMNKLGCSGDEYRLVDCNYEPSTWEHNEDWSVVCINDIPEDGDIRLSIYGLFFYTGAVQVWLNEGWSTVSGEGWTDEDGMVVCLQIGTDGATDVNSRSNDYYGDYVASLPTIITNSQCDGSESLLIDCTHDISEESESLAVVTCYSRCNEGDMRLAGGDISSEGRVEVCSYYDRWGTVCNKQWTPVHSKIVCQYMGYSNEGLLYDAPNTNNIPIIMDFIDCKGSEYSLVDCIHFTHSRGCDHTDDVAIQCQPAQCEDGEVRLISNEQVPEETGMHGVAVVCSGRRWIPICDSTTESNSITVCRQLGYTASKEDEDEDEYLFHKDVRVEHLQCSGDEYQLHDCHYQEVIDSLSSCSFFLFLSCSASCTDGQVRLVEGEYEWEGRLEVCFAERWGTVNGDRWTLAESTVVCNDLGYDTLGIYDSTIPATNSMLVFIDNVQCSNRELNLLECSYNASPLNKQHSNDVGVQCKESSCIDGDLRLFGGDSKYNGLLQICFSKRWGTINGDGWSPSDTLVSCRQLGFENDGIHNTVIGAIVLSAPIHMDNVACYGSENKLIDCTYHTDTSEDSHSEDIWVDCSSSQSEADSNTNDKEDRSIDSSLVVALIALIIAVLVIFILIGYMVFNKQSSSCTRQMKLADNQQGTEMSTDVNKTDNLEETKGPTYETVMPNQSARMYESLAITTLEKETSYETPTTTVKKKSSNNHA